MVEVAEDLKRKVEEEIEREKDEAAETLSKLIQIDSVGAEPVTAENGDYYPFGQGVQDAFTFMLDKGVSDGFSVKNSDNYGGHIEFGEGDEIVGVLGHLDVVPVGTGWEHGPFSGEIIDGYMWGRGTTDDKGPLLAAYFAMKALKEVGYEPARKIRLIMGLDEETGEEIIHYLNDVGAPDFGFTPDANFPALNGEKGVMTFTIAKKIANDRPGTSASGLKLTSLSGGTAVNMVAETARAVVSHKDKKVYDDIKAQVQAFSESTGYELKARKTGSALEITSRGKGAHGAKPAEGLSAISIMFQFLGKLHFENDDITDFIKFYNDSIGFDTTGDFIGCAMEDSKSGVLTFNVGLLNYDGGSITVTINVRYPVTKTADDVYEKLMPAIEKNGLGLVKLEDSAPLYFEPDSELISTLLGSYRDITGDTENGPIVIGGATYARASANIVAFGGLFPGDPDIMHQVGERIEMKRFYEMIRIYADALIRLSSEEFHL
ncbi:MAG: dipeptidase PepV [Eubacteriales bacterium]|nr:dipeptidase PepV [Eubacteriales bacterium]